MKNILLAMLFPLLAHATAPTKIMGKPVSLTPPTDGQILKYNAGYWGAVDESGGGSASASGSAGAIQFSDGASGLSSDETNLFWNNSSKYLGIGVSSPGAPLEISGAHIPILKITDTDGASAAQIQLFDNGGETILSSAAGVEGSVGTQSNHNFQIISNGNDRITVLADGKVGVNQTTPTHAFEVGGDTALSGLTTIIAPASGTVSLDLDLSSPTAGDQSFLRMSNADQSEFFIIGSGRAGQNAALFLSNLGQDIVFGRSAFDTGSFVGSMTIAGADGAVKLPHYGAGVAQFDSSGNISSAALNYNQLVGDAPTGSTVGAYSAIGSTTCPADGDGWATINPATTCDYDSGGICGSQSFTAPSSGLYTFGGSLAGGANGSDWARLAYSVNNVSPTNVFVQYAGNGTTYYAPIGNIVLHLTAGDVVRLFCETKASFTFDGGTVNFVKF